MTKVELERELAMAKAEIVELEEEKNGSAIPFDLPEGEITCAAFIAFMKKPEGKIKLETVLYPGPKEGFKAPDGSRVWGGNSVKAMHGSLAKTFRGRSLLMKRYITNIKQGKESSNG